MNVKDVLIDAKQTFMSKKAEEEINSKYELERFNKLWDNIPLPVISLNGNGANNGNGHSNPSDHPRTLYSASSCNSEEGGFIV